MNVSVIIPTHNRDEKLPACVESVLAQSYTPLEIIVVDDVCSSSTRQCVETLGNMAPISVVYIPNPGFNGPAGSRNIGARTSTGELLAFLDDDDSWHPDYLKEGVVVLNSEGADFVLTASTNIEKNGEYTDGKVPPRKFNREDWIFKNPGGVGSNTIVRRDAFSCVGGYDVSLKSSEDRDLIIRLVDNGSKYAAH